MPDPRLEDIARRAESASHAAEFAELARRGRRRRAIASGAGGAAAVLAVGVMFVGVRGVYADQSAPIPPTQPSHSVTATSPAPPTSPRPPSPTETFHVSCGRSFDCHLIALLEEVGVRRPGLDHGYRGALGGGAYHGRYLIVQSTEIPRSALSVGTRLGSAMLAGVDGSVVATDLNGEVVRFPFGGLTYEVASFSISPQSWRSYDRASSDREHALHAARALVHALQTK